MDVLQLPFNRLIGLELANPDSGFLVCLPDKLQYTNHLGTVHGSAGRGGFRYIPFATLC